MDTPTVDHRYRWSAEDVECLRRWAGKKTAREMAPLVGHTPGAVQKKLGALGLEGWRGGRPPLWTAVQTEALLALAAERRQVTSSAFAAQHGIRLGTVRHWARKLGVRFDSGRSWSAEEGGVRFDSGRNWSAEEVARLKELAPTNRLEALAAVLGRTVAAVRAKARSLGLRYVARVWTPGGRKSRTRTRSGRPATRPRVLSVERCCIEYCPQCSAPVSNWQQHFERMGHRRPTSSGNAG